MNDDEVDVNANRGNTGTDDEENVEDSMKIITARAMFWRQGGRMQDSTIGIQVILYFRNCSQTSHSHLKNNL